MDRENPSRYSEIAINFVLRCECSFEQLSSAAEQCVANTGKHAGMERVNSQGKRTTEVTLDKKKKGSKGDLLMWLARRIRPDVSGS